MMLLITYDVTTKDKKGRTRLRKIAKICQNYGLRVQNSVFECIVDQMEYVQLKHKLLEIVDLAEDSLRIYRLGNNYKNKIEHFGTKSVLNVEDPLVF